jgi:hypothetical protein
MVVFEKKFLGLAAKAERPANPFLEGFGDNGPPQLFLRRSALLKLQQGTLKHFFGPQIKMFTD